MRSLFFFMICSFMSLSTFAISSAEMAPTDAFCTKCGDPGH